MKDLLLLNLSAYFEGVDFSVNLFLVLLTAALIVFSLLYTQSQAAFTALLRQLLRAKASEEGSAKTLSELRLDRSFFIRRILLKNEGRLSHLVKAVPPENSGLNEAEKQTIVSKSTIDSLRFYIPGESESDAQFAVENKAPSLLAALIFCAVILAAAALLFFFMPQILAFLARVLSSD